MNLDLVLGMSCNNIGSLACDQNTGLVAHTASGVLVVLNTKTNCQVKYFHVRKNCVSSASFSNDGRYVTTGETGYRPAVRVWRIKDGQEVATMYGHEFGIKCVQFCPKMTEIISVGLEHDNVVNVWAWPGGHRVAANNIADVIRAVAYSECGSFFVTSGCRHIKFWYPKLTMDQSKHTRTTSPAVQPLYGRPGILGDCKEHTFIDIACGTGASACSVFAITRAGGLVIVSAKDRTLKGHKNIEGVKGTCIKVHDRVLFIGFNNGDIHMFNATTLTHLGALPVPTFFRRTGLNGGGVFTLTFNLCTSYLTTAYKNSSMCVWDMQDAGNVKQKYVAVYHSSAIANLDLYSERESQGTAVRETLVTVSYDSTVRLWGVLIDKTVCYDRLSIFYTDDGGGGGGGGLRVERPRHRTLRHSGVITAVKVSPDRKYIVTGNKSGTICVYDKETYVHVHSVRAHSREVTCLAFYNNTPLGHLALVSGSRDRLIQVMDASNGFHVVNSLNIHSSSITAIKVCLTGTAVCIVSSAADRSISVSEASLDQRLLSGSPAPRRLPSFQLSQVAACVSSPTDMTVDPQTRDLAIGFQDGNIRVLELSQLQEKRAFPGCSTTEAQVNKLEVGPYGALLLSAASDKTINVISFLTGQILHTVTGHNKCVTGLVFTSNGDHVISTSMDGCVFLWRLTSDLLARRREILLTARSTTAVMSHDAIAVAKTASGGTGAVAKSQRLLKGSLSHHTHATGITDYPDRSAESRRPSGGWRRQHSAPHSIAAARVSAVSGGSRGARPVRANSASECLERRHRRATPPPPSPAKKKMAQGDVPSEATSASDATAGAWSSGKGGNKTAATSHSERGGDGGGGAGGCNKRESPLGVASSQSDGGEVQTPGDGGGWVRERLAADTREGEVGVEAEQQVTAGDQTRGRNSAVEKAARQTHACRTYRCSSPGAPVQHTCSRRKLSCSMSRCSPPKPHRHTWRSLLNLKRTEDLEIAKRKMVKMSSY